MTPDVNVLVAASRADHPHHAVAREWLEGVLGTSGTGVGKRLGGNEVPDAWLSAAVAHRGEHLVSFDRDFRKRLARGRFTLLPLA